MREIKFRAWDKRTKEVVAVSGLNWMQRASDETYLESDFYYLSGSKRGEHYKAPLDQFILMQFIGLLDMTGKEIYEGDILQSDTQQSTAKVVWETPGFALQNHLGGMGDFKVSASYRNGKACDYIKIIGNIYENPDLLEPKSEELAA